MTIAADRVDSETVQRPQTWNIGLLRNFMIVFGLLGSVLDFVTFAVLRLGFFAGADLFRSGWFVESVITELAVLMVLRTRRPFYCSRPGRGLVLTSIAVGVVTLWLPYSPLAALLAFTALPTR